MASALSPPVPSNWVFITGTTDASTRRHLLGAAVNVQFNVQTLNQTATVVATSIVTASSPGGSLSTVLTASFTTAGLTAPTGFSGVVVGTTAGTTTIVTKSTKPLKLGLGIGLGLGLGLIAVGGLVWRLFLRPKAIEEGQKSAVQLQPITVMPVPVVMVAAQQ